MGWAAAGDGLGLGSAVCEALRFCNAVLRADGRCNVAHEACEAGPEAVRTAARGSPCSRQGEGLKLNCTVRMQREDSLNAPARSMQTSRHHHRPAARCRLSHLLHFLLAQPDVTWQT